MGMKIEKVSLSDAKELLTIYGPYVEKTAVSFEYDVPQVEEFEKRIAEIGGRYPYIKAVEEGEILGYAYANTFKSRPAYDRAVEVTVYVKEDRRKQGVGRALYGALEKALCDMGILNMNACITFPEIEDGYLTKDSFNFHGKMGFSLVGRFSKVGYKFGNWYDVIWMEKSIGEHTKNPKEVSFGKWDV